MRKNVTVIGMGQRKAGVAKKTGKKYDFTEVAIGYEVDGFSGMKCETIAFDTDMIAEKNVAVGDVLDLVFHQANFKTYVDAIL